jgi:MoaA/NifB/PqqE/SkfB family radical SAM enzyme
VRDERPLGRIVRGGIRAVSVSLDGCHGQTHERIRGIGGHFETTIAAIAELAAAGSAAA